MKIHFSKIILSSVLASTALPVVASAASNALDPKYKYCDDITQIEKLQDRKEETLERLKDEDVKIERIVVSKDRKQLYLISGETLYRAYDVAFGQSPRGHKVFEGDSRTPEGIYFVDLKNPKSDYHLSLHVSYPNAADREAAKKLGKKPGGDIMIHGLPNPDRPYADLARMFHPFNWTKGCMAVTDEQIEQVYALVKEKTMVEICAMTEAPQPPIYMFP
jgi:murein L,D-transpeptidase YafK